MRCRAGCEKVPSLAARCRESASDGVALLDHGDYEAACAATPGWDVYQIECEWRTWYADMKTAPSALALTWSGFARAGLKREASHE